MEIEIVRGLQNISNSFFDFIFTFFTNLCDETLFFAVFLGLYWCYKKEFAYEFGFFYMVNYFINEGLKTIFKRLRPWQESQDVVNKLEARGTSFPSGHTQNYAFQATYLGLKIKKRRAIYWPIVAFFAIVLGASRIYLGQHFLTDVLAGLAVGVGLAFAFKFLKETMPEKIKKVVNINNIILFCIPVALIVFCLVAFANIVSNVESQELIYKFVGGYLGITVGYLIDKCVIKFRENVEKWWQNIVKYVIGIAIVFGVYKLLMSVDAGLTCYICLVYFIVAFVSATIIPILFQILFDRNASNTEEYFENNRKIDKTLAVLDENATAKENIVDNGLQTSSENNNSKNNLIVKKDNDLQINNTSNEKTNKSTQPKSIIDEKTSNSKQKNSPHNKLKNTKSTNSFSLKIKDSIASNIPSKNANNNTSKSKNKTATVKRKENNNNEGNTNKQS